VGPNPSFVRSPVVHHMYASPLQLTFDKETYIKKPEAPEERKHPDLAKLDNRTLYEQLQANKEAAEEEAAARRALAFGALLVFFPTQWMSRCDTHFPLFGPQLPSAGWRKMRSHSWRRWPSEPTCVKKWLQNKRNRTKLLFVRAWQRCGCVNALREFTGWDVFIAASAIANRTFVREEKHLDTELAALRPPVQSKSKGTSVKSVLKTRIKVKKRGAGAGAGSSKAPQAAAAAKRKREPATVDSDKPTKQARTGAAPVAKPNTQPKAQPAGLGLLASYDSSDEDSDTGSDSD